METHRESEGRAVEATAEGLLYVEVECPPELETEFHAWYNLEHFPERLRIPGFLGGRRYAALEGGPRWLAAYWLESPAVLETAEYREWMGPRQTPWTKRMVASTQVRRSVVRRMHSESTGGESQTAGLLAIRYTAAVRGSERLYSWHDGVFLPDLARVPGFVRADRYEDVETAEHLALYHLADPWVVQGGQFARAWTAGWERQRDGLAGWKRTLYVRIL